MYIVYIAHYALVSPADLGIGALQLLRIGLRVVNKVATDICEVILISVRFGAKLVGCSFGGDELLCVPSLTGCNGGTDTASAVHRSSFVPLISEKVADLRLGAVTFSTACAGEDFDLERPCCSGNKNLRTPFGRIPIFFPFRKEFRYWIISGSISGKVLTFLLALESFSGLEKLAAAARVFAR